ncbi:MAG TPA: DUF4214 domain-containing protein [Telluria sp.]|nr:DUF4214 domain-containing protein [Telluria sp.]
MNRDETYGTVVETGQSYYLYPDEPNTTYDDSSNTTLQRAMFTTMAKHIVGTLDHTSSNYFMFRADFAGELTLNYVHPALANGGPVELRLYDSKFNLVRSESLHSSALLSHYLAAPGLYYIDVRATVSGLGPEPFWLLAGLSNASGDDRMVGTPGNDTFTLDAGNDTVIGNGGFDIARYPGLRFNSLVTVSDAGLGIHTVGQGKDTLVGISRLEFSDRTVDLGMDSGAARVYRIYDAVFNRPPDEAGIGFWIHAMDQGTPLLSIAGHFMQSNEFVSMYGANPTNSFLVTGYYRHILDREPEQAGIDFWIDVLADGRASAADVLVAISESAEHRDLLVGQVSHGVTYIPYGGP